MKATVVPSVCSFLSAVTALLFYMGLSRVHGDQFLGTVIFISSTMTMLQVVVVPQSRVYIVGLSSSPELEAGFSAGVLAEVFGGFVGLAVVLLAFLVTSPEIRDYAADALLVYAGIWIAGTTSSQGYLRAKERWLWYTAWTVLPNMLRMGTIFFFLATGLRGGGPEILPEQRHLLFFVYFLLPELVGRLALINAKLLHRHFRLLSGEEFLRRFRAIWHNWLFDIGSALTEVADKVVVGAAMGPEVLIPYFFGRKVGAATAMVIEPFYLEQYRRLNLTSDPAATQSRQRVIYARGVLFAGAIFVVLAICLAGLVKFPEVSGLVPQAIRENGAIFILVMLIECGIAANRWTRYISQLSGKSAQLLLFRSALCLVFTLQVYLFGGAWGGLGLCLAFFGVWLVESLYVNLLLRKVMVTPPSFFAGA